jgi:hypothetical protein
MLGHIEARTGVRPTELFVDGGYTSHDAIDQTTAAGVTLYAPVPKPRNNSSAQAGRQRRRRRLARSYVHRRRQADPQAARGDRRGGERRCKAHRGMAATALRGLDKVTGGACLSSPSPTTSCASSS